MDRVFNEWFGGSIKKPFTQVEMKLSLDILMYCKIIRRVSERKHKKNSGQHINSNAAVKN